MSIEFRSRIPSAIDYDTILNYGICCQQGVTLESNNHVDCYNKSGFFVVGDPNDPSTICPTDHV